MYDVIIIGAGPAGISASLYTKRGNLNTLVIYNDEKSNMEKTENIENYYGFPEGIKGETLYDFGIKQAKNMQIQLEKEEVLKIEKKEEDIFNVETDKKKYTSKAIILATGSKRKTPEIKGIKNFESRGISYCVICDGFFYRDKDVAVLGNGKYALSETNDLLNIAKKVTILTNGEKAPEIRANNVEVNDKRIQEFSGEGKLEEVKFDNNTVLKIDGLFIAEGTAGGADFAKKLGIIAKENKIIVNENMETNIQGIYACGDCVGGLLQISKAVYEGSKAGLQVIKYLKNK